MVYCQHVPPPLKAGDRVSIIFPAGSVKEKELVELDSATTYAMVPCLTLIERLGNISRCQAAQVTRITWSDLPCIGSHLEGPIRNSGLKILVRKWFKTLVNVFVRKSG
jgi:hypothetical protein